jgi:hypothetical protein
VRNDLRIDQVDGLIFLVPTAHGRATANQQYIFKKVQKLFGADIANNLTIAATFADAGPAQIVASLQELRINYRSVLPFNSDAVFFQNTGESLEVKIAKLQWAEAMESFRTLMAALSAPRPQIAAQKLQQLPNREYIIVLPHGIHSLISSRIEGLNRIRQQISHLRQYSSEFPMAQEHVIRVRSYKQIARSNEPVRFCVTCNVRCTFKPVPDSHSSGDLTCWDCPGKCSASAHATLVDIEYEKVQERHTVGGLIVAYSDDPLNPNLNTIVARMNAKSEEIAQELESRVRMAAIYANQLDNSQKFRSEQHFLDLLIGIEDQRRQPGYKIRLEVLRLMRDRFAAGSRE